MDVVYLDIHFIENTSKNKHIVFFDENNSWIKANVPGVIYSLKFIEHIKEIIKEINMEYLLKDMKPENFTEMVTICFEHHHNLEDNIIL
jgi:hypothetical protein